jgi:signal transduction histidine kinase
MERKPTYDQLLKRIHDLEGMLNNKETEVDQLKNLFLSHINHEIRTPMNSIIGFSNLLADESITPDQRDVYLDYINNSSEHLLSLVENLIDISMIESGQLQMYEGPCNLYDLFNDLYLSFNKIRHRKEKYSIALLLNREIREQDLIIVIDHVRLEQVLSNLIENAMRYTEKGLIEFGYRLKNRNTLQFFVNDTGRGIEADHQHVVFNSFRKTSLEEGPEVGGAGLGLAIAKGLVGLMGGDIWLEPNVTRGSVFKFNLPLKLKDLPGKKINTDTDDFFLTNKDIAI